MPCPAIYTSLPFFPPPPPPPPPPSSPMASSHSFPYPDHQISQPSPPPFSPSAPPLLPINTTTATTSSSVYPTLDHSDLNDNLIPIDSPTSLKHSPSEETLLRVPGAFLHLIDKQRSVELASGELSVVGLRQGDSFVAVLVRVGEDDDAVQWPLARDAASVKLDGSHYFFSLRVPGDQTDNPRGGAAAPDVLSYGLTFASKGQESLLKELDGILESYSSFSEQKVRGKEPAEALDGSVAGEVTPAEVMAEGPKKAMMEERSAAYWTTLAPNVEDYSGLVAKAIAVGSGQLVKGILWCGDVTVERLKWGNDLLMKRIGRNEKPSEISPETLERIKRAKRFTQMSEKVAGGVLGGVVKVSGYVSSSVANSKAGKKLLSLVPGEVLVASLEGFGKICDAFELTGKNVLSTSSVVTTGIVTHRYGEQAGAAANEGLDAAGHAVGTAWAVFKIKKAIDPRSSIKPHVLGATAARAAAAELKAKAGK